MRRVLLVLAASVLACAAALVGAQAAHAAPYWQPVRPDGTWRCNGNLQHAASPLVLFDACVIVSGAQVRTALLVYNKTGRTIRIHGRISDRNTVCYESPLSHGYQRGCLTAVRTLGCFQSYQSVVTLTVNGIEDYALTPVAYRNCPV